MRLGRRHHKQEEAQVDMTSMLDIVFIMLIFFIVTSSFVRESGVEVNRPTASNVVSQKEAGIFVAITSANDIYIDKRMVDVERVEATLEHLMLDKPDASLVIQADEHAYSGTVVKVMDAAKGAGVKNIALAAEKI
ncbi:biopolymer transporter ExbD [Vibrio europaeus]|jgi:biopolymer transport protein ExbD|uniref:Biopolymer transporter ExbD n=3 Tax=Vibrio oreintalis group TaxID=1891919 RepID=F9T6M6_9VIBR|nr:MULTISPECIES: biopolymer transporter ExbD [Vibrio oreintalis group]AIW14190.1 biopolymer transporter ExbD [Vibrio tubiashii ATCC 19109]EGU54569.1 putative TonB system transport protein [Vibrio tubiashii ATCC 19109]EIF02858.1 TonB system transport protein [Vibrio tubiashii NCIMB 1337 = ATCC 19106]MCG9576756.1 biopolymer transporter ExbD [Vibrio tubiashii]MCG9582454.1 biopolymer transporter ExbD [Vibrio tubiashii]